MASELFLDWTCETKLLTVDRLYSLLEASPFDSWSKGEKHKRFDKLHQNSGFRIRKLIQNPIDKEILIREFLLEHYPAMMRVRDADKAARINFTCALYTEKEEGLFLEPDLCKILSETESELNYDLYLSEAFQGNLETSFET